MEIQNKNDGKRGAFFIGDDGAEIALMHYIFSGAGKMITDHTEVNEAYEGKGLGLQLVKEGRKGLKRKKYYLAPGFVFSF